MDCERSGSPGARHTGIFEGREDRLKESGLKESGLKESEELPR